MLYIPRNQTLLPGYPDSHYPGPYQKKTVCWHHMCGAGTGDPVSLNKARQLQQNNYNWHLHRWSAIDILEGYDLYDVDGEAALLEGRPWWSNCDAFSGMAKLGYTYIGIEVDGNYQSRQPSDTILQGCSEALAWLYRGGKISSLDSTGHRAFNAYSNVGPTNCPGDYLWARIPEINATAKRLVAQPSEEDEDMIYSLQRQPDQGTKKVWVGPDAFTSLPNLGDFLCYLNIYNESESPTEVEIYTSPSHPEGVREYTMKKWERYGVDLKQLNGNKNFTGAVIVKANKETIAPTLTMLRL